MSSNLKEKALSAAIDQINKATNRDSANKAFLIWKDAFKHNHLFKKAITEKKQELKNKNIPMVRISGLPNNYIEFEEVIQKIVDIKNDPKKKGLGEYPQTFNVAKQIYYVRDERKLFFDIDSENLDTVSLLFYINGLIEPKFQIKNGVIDLTYEGSFK